MNLFSQPAPQKPETPPSIDAARQKVGELKRRSLMMGRASALLTQGKQRPNTAQRQVTGN